MKQSKLDIVSCKASAVTEMTCQVVRPPSLRNTKLNDKIVFLLSKLEHMMFLIIVLLTWCFTDRAIITLPQKTSFNSLCTEICLLTCNLLCNRYNLGKVLEALGDCQRASDCMATALQVDTVSPILPYSSIPITFE